MNNRWVVLGGAAGWALAVWGSSLHAAAATDRKPVDYESAADAMVAREMDRNDRLCLWRDPPLHVRHIQIVGGGAEVREYRHTLLIDHANHGADIRNGGRNDFIARSDSRGIYGDVNGRSAG